MRQKSKIFILIAAFVMCCGQPMLSYAESGTCSMLKEVPSIQSFKVGDSFRLVREKLLGSNQVWFGVTAANPRVTLPPTEDLSAGIVGVQIDISMRKEEIPWFKRLMRWFEIVRSDEHMQLKFDNQQALSEIICKEILTGP